MPVKPGILISADSCDLDFRVFGTAHCSII
jgi:hypothetical protein